MSCVRAARRKIMFSHRGDVISRFCTNYGDNRCSRITQRWTKAVDITWVSPTSSKDLSVVVVANVNAWPAVCYFQLPAKVTMASHGA